jgi:hypothetical protein
VLDCFACGETIAETLGKLDSADVRRDPRVLSSIEKAVIAMPDEERSIMPRPPEMHAPVRHASRP